LNGQKTLAKNYLDSVILAKDTLNAKLNALYLLRATQMEQAKKMRDEQEKVRLTEQSKKFQLIISGVIIVFLVIIAILIYRNQKRKRRLEQLESDRKLSAAEQKLLEAREHLQTFIADIAEKEKLIKKLSRDPENADELDKVMSSAILTPDDWKRFKESFETVHPLFFQKIHKKVSDITPAEIRMLALLKMQLSQKEIAAMLGVSLVSIRVTWHRIRKKMYADENLTMTEFVENL
jgi:DNA-directed RNA polymerase specialized sigma24 family protein